MHPDRNRLLTVDKFVNAIMVLLLSPPSMTGQPNPVLRLYPSVEEPNSVGIFRVISFRTRVIRTLPDGARQ